MKITTLNLQNLQFEIEGKIGTNELGEKKQLMDGILKSEILSQKIKVDLRKKSKDIQELIKIASEQEKDIREKYIDTTGETPQIKEGKLISDFNSELSELYSSEHEIAPIEGLSKETILSISNTTDFYELLIELQS